MNFLLEMNYKEPLNIADALSFGGQTVLLGMATIFAVLIIIWVALAILKVFLHDLPAKKEGKAEASPEPTAPVVPATAKTSDDEIIAVIAAAIAAAESESGGAKFRVVSFKRK